MGEKEEFSNSIKAIKDIIDKSDDPEMEVYCIKILLQHSHTKYDGVASGFGRNPDGSVVLFKY